MPKSKHFYSSKSFIKCKNWIKWPKCNFLDSKPSCCCPKTWPSSSNGKYSSNSLTTKPRYRCRTNNTRWCCRSPCTATTCNLRRTSIWSLKRTTGRTSFNKKGTNPLWKHRVGSLRNCSAQKTQGTQRSMITHLQATINIAGTVLFSLTMRMVEIPSNSQVLL